MPPVTEDEVIEEIEQQTHEEQHALDEQSGAEGGESASGEATHDDEVVVSIGEETPASDEENRAPEWVRELRKQNREKDRKLREQEAEIARLKGAGSQPATIEVGAKPTLEGCDFDAEKFESDLEAWHQRKREADEQEAQKTKTQKQQQEAWQAKLDGYGKAKEALKVKDYDEAEAAVTDTLSVVQQGVILNGAENPALLVYALGKNPAKAKELANIGDPVKFAFAVAKLETQLKVTPKKATTVPERTVRSSVSGAAAVDNQLEKLREDAAKTGDLTKVIAYKRQSRKS